jgi:hypothetical protein
MGRRADTLCTDSIVRRVWVRVRNVAHVVRAVQILPIPARGEGNDRSDAADTEPSR